MRSEAHFAQEKSTQFRRNSPETTSEDRNGTAIREQLGMTPPQPRCYGRRERYHPFGPMTFQWPPQHQGRSLRNVGRGGLYKSKKRNSWCDESSPCRHEADGPEDALQLDQEPPAVTTPSRYGVQTHHHVNDGSQDPSF